MLISRETAAAMRQFVVETTGWPSAASKTCMESPTPPPEKRTSFPSPALVYIIVGVIAAAFVMFLVLRPH